MTILRSIGLCAAVLAQNIAWSFLLLLLICLLCIFSVANFICLHFLKCIQILPCTTYQEPLYLKRGDRKWVEWFFSCVGHFCLWRRLHGVNSVYIDKYKLIVFITTNQLGILVKTLNTCMGNPGSIPACAISSHLFFL